MKKYIALLAGICCLAIACTKDAEQPQPPPLAWLMVYNGSPDFYDAYGMVLRNNIPYTTLSYNDNGAGLVGAFNFSKYNFIDTGSYRIGFTDSSTVPGQAKKLTETLFRFKDQQHYTIYLLDSLGFYETMYTLDEVEKDTAMAKIRLINLSADAGPVYLRIDSLAIDAIKNVSYRGVTAFTAIRPDIKPGIRIMYRDDSGEEKTLVRKSFPLEAGKCYTMILRGYRKPPDASINKTINLSTITNF